tara:strand:- start:243 stop:443 length:201 start_codon:yes stop_codon:yes gene_type:complete
MSTKPKELDPTLGHDQEHLRDEPEPPKLKDGWKPVEWPTIDELQKLHEDKTLVGTARTILEKSVDN